GDPADALAKRVTNGGLAFRPLMKPCARQVFSGSAITIDRPGGRATAEFPPAAAPRFRRAGASDPAFLRRTAAVVRDRRDVLDLKDLDAERVQRAHRRLAAGAGALDLDLEVLDAAFLRRTARRLGSHLRRERGRLARALEAR